MACPHTITALCIAVCVLTPGATAKNAGTTSNIQDIFVGRCWDYNVTKYQGTLPRVDGNCNKIWDQFSSAFKNRPACGVSDGAYEGFFESVSQKLPQNKSMFWSGTYVIAHRYADAARFFVTLEDTMAGYLANSLVWCGQAAAPGFDFTHCQSCKGSAVDSFWSEASTKFAQEAHGPNVTVLLSGSNPNKPAYRNDSVFATYELPNMSESVKVVNVLVVHELGEPRLERCTTGSLVTLRKDIEDHGLKYICEDDPLKLMFLLCSEHPHAAECQLLMAHLKGELSFLTDRPIRLLGSKPLDRMSSH